MQNIMIELEKRNQELQKELDLLNQTYNEMLMRNNIEDINDIIREIVSICTEQISINNKISKLAEEVNSSTILEFIIWKNKNEQYC